MVIEKLVLKRGIFVKKVAIIGAGIVGAAAAYELVQKGIEVTLIDRHDKGRATSAAAGIICPWITQRRNKAWYELAANGAAYYEQLISNLHNDGAHHTGYKKVGAIRLHTDKEKLIPLEKLALQRRETAPQIGEISILSQKETKQKFPFLNGEHYSLFIEGAARVDGRALRESLIQAAVKYGATYVKGNAQLIYSGKEITGVRVEERAMYTDMTIATNGVWMNELLKPLGIDLQIQYQKGEIIHLHTAALDTSILPVVMPPGNQYLLCFDHGRIVIGATRENVTNLNIDKTVGGIHYVLDQALKVFPLLTDCAIVESRVGFRPFTFNHVPVFGSIPSLDRLLIANGLGASGLTTGPFIGRQLAKMVNGEEPELDIDHYKVEQTLKS